MTDDLVNTLCDVDWYILIDFMIFKDDDDDDDDLIVLINLVEILQKCYNFITSFWDS